eukprot:598338-Rhodomonas_salina.1
MMSAVENLKKDPLAHTDIEFHNTLAEWVHDIPKTAIRVGILKRRIKGREPTEEEKAAEEAARKVEEAAQRERDREYMQRVLPDIQELERRVKIVEDKLTPMEKTLDDKRSTQGMLEKLDELQKELDDIEDKRRGLRDNAATHAASEVTTSIEHLSTRISTANIRVVNIRNSLQGS